MSYNDFHDPYYDEYDDYDDDRRRRRRPYYEDEQPYYYPPPPPQPNPAPPPDLAKAATNELRDQGRTVIKNGRKSITQLLHFIPNTVCTATRYDVFSPISQVPFLIGI
jgi:hypothetical protein